MLKILQARLQQYMNHELPDVQAGFSSWKRHRNQKSNCHHPFDHLNSKRVTEKHLLLLHWLHQSLWMCGSQQTGKFLKRWENQTTWPASWEIWMQVKKQQLELDMEQQIDFTSGKEYIKAVYCHPVYLTYMQSTSWEMLEQQIDSTSGKEYIKAVYCHPVYLTYMQSTSWEMLDWMKHKLESRLLRELSITWVCRWHHTYGRKWRRTKEPLDESERGEWKSWLKTQHSEN